MLLLYIYCTVLFIIPVHVNCISVRNIEKAIRFLDIWRSRYFCILKTLIIWQYLRCSKKFRWCSSNIMGKKVYNIMSIISIKHQVYTLVLFCPRFEHMLTGYNMVIKLRCTWAVLPRRCMGACPDRWGASTRPPAA